jgi:hypothetical protein
MQVHRFAALGGMIVSLLDYDVCHLDAASGIPAMKCWTTAIPSLSRLFVVLSGGFLATILAAEDRRPIPAAHPRVLGSRAELQALAKQRPAEYHRMVAVARRSGADEHAAIVFFSHVLHPPDCVSPPWHVRHLRPGHLHQAGVQENLVVAGDENTGAAW